MLTDNGILLLASALLCLLFFIRIQQIRKVWQAFGNLPAHFLLLSPVSSLSRIARRIPWVSNSDFDWMDGHKSQDLPGVSFSIQLMVYT